MVVYITCIKPVLDDTRHLFNFFNELDILEEQKRFYENLYKSQVSSVQSAHENEIVFNPNAVPTLNADEQALCEGLITETEALNALKDFSAKLQAQTDCLLNF